MEIIIDATSSQTMAYAGIGQYTKNVIESLISSYPNHTFHLMLFDGITTIDSDILENDNVRVYRIGKAPSALIGMFTYWMKIAPTIQKIHNQVSEPVFFTPYYRNGFPTSGIPTALLIHDFAMPRFNYYSDKGNLINYIRKTEFWFHHDRSEKCSAILVDSEFTAVDYMKYYPNYEPEKVFPILLGIDLEEVEENVDRYLPKDWKEKGYILYMGGGIQKSKNSIGVIKSYAKYLEKLVDIGVDEKDTPYLVIAGKIFLNRSFAESVRLHDLIEKLGIKNKVHFSGFYEDSAKYSLLQNSLFFIHLSLIEGFGIAVAEAMKAGTPVIAHSGSSYLEVVGDAGFLVDGNDYEEVSDMMLKVSKLDTNVLRIIEDAKTKAMNYNWDKTASKTEAILTKIHKEFYEND